MKTSNLFRTACAVTMAILMSNIPNVVFAETSMNSTSPMISATAVVQELTRAQAIANVRSLLQKPEAKQELIKRGLSEKEAEIRLASLSESELRMLSGQIDEARAGGDILITILLVVLIIFLIKRI